MSINMAEIMDANDIWPYISGAILILFVFLYVAYSRRGAKLLNADKMLRRIRQEMQDLTQLPLNNPTPLVQISREGAIIFANPASTISFPEIGTDDFNAQSFFNIDKAIDYDDNFSEQFLYKDRIYQKLVVPAKIGGRDAYILYFHDISELKSQEEDLRRSKNAAEKSSLLAEQANKARGDFLANISHELRTPMNGILGLSDILNDSGLKSEHHELAKAINISARGLLGLLNDILDFSKIDAGQLELETIAFELRQVSEIVRVLQSPVASKKGLILSVAVDDKVPDMMIGDPSRVQQILNNLVSNAIKFTDRGFVDMRIGGAPGNDGQFHARISVSDTGIGIPKSQQDKLFRKFQQADSSTSRKYGGTGLGLAITKDLCVLMGGHIEMKSEEGKGTKFIVTIPFEVAIQEDVKNAPGSHQELAKNAIRADAKILFVDDHPVNRIFMRQALKILGYTNFDEACSGAEAIHFFSQNRHELILMDCQMPEMSGYEATEKIRAMQDTGTVKIIAVTADAIKGAAEKCRQAGMDDYISKPIEKEKLRAVLHKWIPASGQQESGEGKSVGELVIGQSKVFDEAWLNELLEGDEEAKGKIITLYLNKTQSDIEILGQKLYAEDYESWASVTHKIYGSSANIGAFALAHICEEAQYLKAQDHERMKTLYPHILDEYKRLHHELHRRSAHP